MRKSTVPGHHGVDLPGHYFDADHRAMLEGLNALTEALASKDRALVLDATGRLEEIAGKHFAREEQSMRESGYHSTARHCASHGALLQRLAEFREKARLAQDFSAIQADSAFLGQWLAPHIKKDDRLFSEFLSVRAYASKVGHP